jgi:hypothetical protein
VGFEIKKTAVLALQSRQKREQRDVFVDVREAAGMKTMSVLHRMARMRPRRRAARDRSI